MQAKFEVHMKVHESWPARNGKPAGQRDYFLLLDRSQPPKHRLRDMYMFTIRDEDIVGQQFFRGEPEGRVLDVGVNKIINGKTGPILIGEIIGESPE